MITFMEFVGCIKAVLIIISFVIAIMLIVLICEPTIELENDKSPPFVWMVVFGSMILFGSHLSMYFHLYGTTLMYLFDMVLILIIEVITHFGKMRKLQEGGYIKKSVKEEKETTIKNHPA